MGNKILGKIYRKDKRVVIDAKPYIMGRLRSLFPSHKSEKKGEFTVKAISVGLTLPVCRDIGWVLDRYKFECDQELLDYIEVKSEEHDKLFDDIAQADKDNTLKITENALPMAVDLRDHQIGFNNLASKVGRILLADKLGLGKTISSLSMLAEPDSRPAMIILPPTLIAQWERELKKVFPDITYHTIKGRKPYDLPDVDVIITTYTRIHGWKDAFEQMTFNTIILDEVHELRRLGTKKREAAKEVSERAKNVIGLSGTPIYNYGEEIWSVIDAISPDSLGEKRDFVGEWCDGLDQTVKDTVSLNSFLRDQGLLLRREPHEVDLDFGKIQKYVHTIEADIDELKKVEKVAKTLALSALSGQVGLDSEAAREFDWKLRKATGVAKAKPAAEFVKMILNEEEKVILTAWHRDFYEIVMKELEDYSPVMFTGSETPAQKQKSIDAFINGDSRVFVISLRSGAGIDGLQHVCNTIVHGELDWSPFVMEQLNGRVDRDGQLKSCIAYYLTIPDGSDPTVIQKLNIKRSQHEGIVEGKGEDAAILSSVSKDRFRDMATNYLKSIGEEIPEAFQQTGLLAEVSEAIGKVRVTQNTEEEMQKALDNILPELLSDCTIEREYKISKRSRLDFLITKGGEKVIVECKINAKKRADVYRQIRRYLEDLDVSGVVLAAPWSGISDFIIDEVPVSVVDTAMSAL